MTKPENLKVVGGGVEVVFAIDTVLSFLEVGIKEFNNFTAFKADQVVMVFEIG